MTPRLSRIVREVQFTYAQPSEDGPLVLVRPDENGVPVADYVAITIEDARALAEALDRHYAGLEDDINAVRAQIGQKLYQRAGDNAEFTPDFDRLFRPPARRPGKDDPAEREVWRRISVATDGAANVAPVEALVVDRYRAVAAQAGQPLSVLRRIGPESARTREIGPAPGGKLRPLRMLVVFSLDDRLGRLATNQCGDALTFAANSAAHVPPCAAELERRALDQALAPLVRLGLLDIHFDAGCACSDHDGPRLVSGRVVPTANGVAWQICAGPQGAVTGSLQSTICTRLQDEDWDIFHYYGHGGTGAAGHYLPLEPDGERLTAEEVDVCLDNHTDGGPWRTDAGPRIVVLHACGASGAHSGGTRSAVGAGRNAQPPAGDRRAALSAGSAAITGFPASFCKWGCVVFIGSQMRLSAETATAVTAHVYAELAESLFTEPMDAEVGVYRARLERLKKGSPDFFCPVIYRRSVSGPIFTYKDHRVGLWRQLRNGERTFRPSVYLRLRRWRRAVGG